MITILICTVAGLLCVVMGWVSGRACLRRELPRMLEHEHYDGYNLGYMDGYWKAQLRLAPSDIDDDK